MAGRVLFFTSLLGLAGANFISPGLGKCLDIYAEKKKDGQRQTIEDLEKVDGPINVQLYRCHEEENQHFGVEKGQIKSPHLGRCLAAVKKEPNANVVLAKCAEDDELQTWNLTEHGYTSLRGTDLCLDVLAKKKDDGSREKWDEIKQHAAVNVQLYTCHDAEKTKRVNQLWSWTPVNKDKIMEIITAFSAVRPSDLGLSAPAHSRLPVLSLAVLGAAGAFSVGLFVGRRRQRSVLLETDLEGDQ